MKAAVLSVEKAEGAIDVLVNNAGYSQSGAVEEVTPDMLRKQFDTNVFGLVRMCQLVLPGMRKGARAASSHRLHGRSPHVSRRRRVPRHQARGGGAQRRPALRVGGFVQVVLIQPGLIRTEFSATVQEHMAGMIGGDGPTRPSTRTWRGPRRTRT
jgi:NAD(P)-dependent dehydrogenase (short-subunit alcohol dehydrogenase family)